MIKSIQDQRVYLFGLLALSLALAACGSTSAATEPPTPEPTQAPVVSHPNVVGGYVDLVDALTKGGAKVELGEDVDQAFFSVPGRILKVNGADVQVFEYDDAAAREAESANITPDGQPSPTMMVTWVDQPNFWAKGRVIVLYLGQDADMIERLTQILDKPITQSASQ